jgi:hypothetical protein
MVDQNLPHQRPSPGQIPAPGKRLSSRKYLISYLFIGGIAIVLGFSMVAMGFAARDEYLVTRGAAGTPGTVTITDKSSGPGGKTTCYGSFRPDKGGRRPADVEVLSDGACKPGRTARAHMKNDYAYVAGERQNDWMMVFVVVPLLGMGTLGCGVAAVLGVRHERKLRKQARSATVPIHPMDQPYPGAQPHHF